jgi:hypothetical protein
MCALTRFRKHIDDRVPQTTEAHVFFENIGKN